MRDILDAETAHGELPDVIERFVQAGLADARAQLEADPWFTPARLAQALATIERTLREENSKTIRSAWLRLHPEDGRVQ